MSTYEITYHYASLEQSIADIRSVVQKMTGEVDELEAQTQIVMKNWQADGSIAYQGDASAIKNELTEFDQTLGFLAKAIEEGAQNFKLTDTKIAAQF